MPANTKTAPAKPPTTIKPNNRSLLATTSKIANPIKPTALTTQVTALGSPTSRRITRSAGTLASCNTGGKPNANNIPKWCNAKFKEVVDKAAEITDQAERTKLYQEAQKIQAEEMPQVNIAHSTVFEPISKKVTGYKVSPLGSHEFQNVDITE